MLSEIVLLFDHSKDMMLQFLKWSATAILIAGTFVNAGYPELYPIGPALLVFGGFVWLAASVIMRDAALMVTNLVMSTVGLLGIIFFTLTKG